MTGSQHCPPYSSTLSIKIRARGTDSFQENDLRPLIEKTNVVSEGVVREPL